MIIHNVTQQTDEWFRLRAGRPTASRFSSIVTPKGKPSSQQTDYATELMADCIRPDELGEQWTGNRHTDRGNELEPEARDKFAADFQMEVEQVGFVTRDDLIVGCSPDSMVRNDGEWIAGLEIKCPLPKHHARYVINGTLPDDYKIQVHGSMAVTGLNYWYFMSYCPGMKPFYIRVDRDEFTELVSSELDKFLIFYASHREKCMHLLTP